MSSSVSPRPGLFVRASSATRYPEPKTAAISRMVGGRRATARLARRIGLHQLMLHEARGMGSVPSGPTLYSALASAANSSPGRCSASGSLQ